MDPNKLKYILGRLAFADREELLDRLQRDELSDVEQFALRNSADAEDRALYALFRPLDSSETAQILSCVLGDRPGELAAVTRSVEDSMEGRSGPRSTETTARS